MGISFRDLIVVMLVVALYFVPTIAAMQRHHKDAVAICMLNLFGGWLFVPWVIALIWAFKRPTHANRP